MLREESLTIKTIILRQMLLAALHPLSQASHLMRMLMMMMMIYQEAR